MTFSLYSRLRVPTWASDRDVIAAVRNKIEPHHRRNPALRHSRHALYRNMIAEHRKAQRLVLRHRL